MYRKQVPSWPQKYAQLSTMTIVFHVEEPLTNLVPSEPPERIRCTGVLRLHISNFLFLSYSAMSLSSTVARQFDIIENCSSEERETHTAVADFDGSLLRGRSSSPYFMLVALEGGSLLRAVLLGLVAPLAWLLYHCISEAAAVQLLIFVAFAGLKVSDIEKVARGVLPKFYSQDVHSETYRVFSACGKRYVVTANPRIMVEHFAKSYLGADKVLGTEIEVSKLGRATGFLKYPGVLVGQNKRSALKQEFTDEELPDLGIGDRDTDQPFMSLCKEAFLVTKRPAEAVSPSKLRQVVFHDGRMVRLPTPLVALATFLWLPIAFPLAITRVILPGLFPHKYHWLFHCLLGVRLVVKGEPPKQQEGFVFVCNHRTLVDPIFVCVAASRWITGLTYSISRVSEVLSPIPLVRLTRDRAKDAAKMKELLEQGRNLGICPEGTTCREPFLLRFSPLFTELTDRIVPVALTTKQTMFHGTSARGWKGMDSFFFMMNVRPVYEVTFLEQLPREWTVQHGGKAPVEVANHIQRLISDALGYECTNLTRKDKYMQLAGSDGTVKVL